MINKLILSLVLAITCSAQNNLTSVGMITNHQYITSNIAGAQTIQCYTDTPAPVGCPTQHLGVSLGGLLYFYSMGFICPYLNCNTSGIYMPVFAIGFNQPWSWGCYPIAYSTLIPGGFPGFDEFFVNSAQDYVLALPMVVQQVQVGPYLHDIFSVVMQVYPDPALLDCFVEAQALRVDPLNGFIYASDRLTIKLLQ